MMTKNAETTLTDLGFTPEESHTIIKIGRILTVPEDTVVEESCYLSEFLYIILDGCVNAYFINLQGKTTLLGHYGIGEYFGGIEFGDTPHSTSIKTIQASSFLQARISDLKALLPQTDKLQNEFLKIF